MRKSLFVLFVILFGIGSLYPAQITVMSPNGGENWQIGSTHNITWKSSGITGNIGIKLFKNGKSLGYIVQSVPVSTKIFRWTISRIIGKGSISAGLGYQIQIKKSGVTGDLSNGKFTISSATHSASITVTSPNGGEDWHIGSTHNITWNSSGITGNIGIKLFKDGKSLGYIVQSIPASTKIFKWTISNIIGKGSISAGSGYQIQIKKSGVAGDFSNGKFTISSATHSASITVTAPKSTDTLYTGKPFNIRWKGIGIMDSNVIIEIYKNTIMKSNFVVKLTSVNNGSKTWNVPSNFNPGKYQIRVKTSDNRYFGDSNVFNIQKSFEPDIKIIPGFNQPSTLDKSGYSLADKYRIKNYLDQSLDCKISVDKSFRGYKDEFGNVLLKISIQNANSYTLVRKDKNGKKVFIPIPGIKLPTLFFETKIKDSPVTDCEYLLTVRNNKGKTKTSSFKIFYYFHINLFNCPTKARYDEKIEIIISVTGAKSVTLTDSKGKNYPLGFDGKYIFVKFINLYFQYPTKFKLTIKNAAGEELVKYREVKEQYRVFPR